MVRPINPVLLAVLALVGLAATPEADALPSVLAKPAAHVRAATEPLYLILRTLLI